MNTASILSPPVTSNVHALNDMQNMVNIAPNVAGFAAQPLNNIISLVFIHVGCHSNK